MEALNTLRARQAEIRTELTELEDAADGARFTDTQKARWNALNEEFDANREHIEELEARQEVLAKRVADGQVEKEERSTWTRGQRKLVPDDPADITAYRTMARDFDELNRAYEEGAKRLNERMVPALPHADRESTQERIERLLTVADTEDRSFARRVINTSSETYRRAFGKHLAGMHLERDEERALSLTTTAGGYAVPYTLDPTVILTSAGQINPIRRLARVEMITGNTWYGVSSTGVTASYGAEATETSDNAPTLAQPSLNVEKAQAFIPFSIEIGQDWGALVTEMGRLFADAKDRLENTQFLTGLGHGSNAPQGLIAVGGATAVVSSATTAVLAVADLYSLRNSLSDRWHDNASIVAHRATWDKVRQFDTAGGANLWVQLQYDQPPQVLGYPAYTWNAYSSATTTSGSTLMTIGDFSNFLIVDRVGMDVELIPHLFATANNRPSGQRGLYCYWRNSSTVLTPGLLANSAFVSLKLL